MNIAGIIAGHAQTRADKVAIDTGNLTVTYAELDDLVRRIAVTLREAGVGSGDRVAVRMRETHEHVAALVSINRLGAIVVPIDWRAAAPELEKVIESIDPRLILTDADGLPPLTIRMVHIRDIAAVAGDVPPAPLDHAPFAYAMTSGTTGRPKMFSLSHEGYHHRVMAFRASGLILPEDRLLGPIPLAFAAGREMALGLMVQGATFLMMRPLFEPAEFVAAAVSRNATVALASPNTSRALLAFAGDGAERLMPNLRLYINATAKAEPEERSRLRQRVAVAVADMYGTTGAGLVSVVSDTDDRAGRARTSVGRPVPGITLEVVGDDHNPLPAGEIGRIRLQGPGVVTRFVHDEPFGDEGIRDGWYYPGDIGSIDVEGFLHLHDRAADLIKRGGVMIHAQEIEGVLRAHPAVADVAVVGLAHALLGQEVAAFVVAEAGMDARTLTVFCRERLAGYKVPTQFSFVNALPRNAIGKVVKVDLPGLQPVKAGET